ncbi:MAG TPA: hypothetical protein VN176_00890 [Verrucomicrobiae bacterium]|jgi:hypothetical protein|nr:hypothetical protein [Verrucomicrobiae bacterium]
MLKYILFVAGFMAFVTAFSLPSIKTGGTDYVRGFWCAWVAFRYPWDHDGLSMLHDNSLRYFALLLSGWINPLFLVVCVLLWTKLRRLTSVLIVLLVLMFPCCWAVFHYENVAPVVGYYVWAASMLLVVFSRTIGDTMTRSAAK